jgi:hypothetical protein
VDAIQSVKTVGSKLYISARNSNDSENSIFYYDGAETITYEHGVGITDNQYGELVYDGTDLYLVYGDADNGTSFCQYRNGGAWGTVVAGLPGGNATFCPASGTVTVGSNGYCAGAYSQASEEFKMGVLKLAGGALVTAVQVGVSHAGDDSPPSYIPVSGLVYFNNGIYFMARAESSGVAPAIPAKACLLYGANVGNINSWSVICNVYGTTAGSLGVNTKTVERREQLALWRQRMFAYLNVDDVSVWGLYKSSDNTFSSFGTGPFVANGAGTNRSLFTAL